MEVEIAARNGYLEVSVSERGGTGDARIVLQKIIAAVQTGGHQRLLISVKRSPAIFRVEEYGLSDALMRAAGVPGLKVALVADTGELLVSYQYVELLASQKGLETKAFRSETDALAWLLG